MTNSSKQEVHRISNKKNTPVFAGRIVPIIITLAWAGIAVGIGTEKIPYYSEVLGRGHRIPFADQFFIAGFLLIAAILMIQVWYPQCMLRFQRLRSRLGWLRWLLVLIPALAVSWFFVFSSFSARFDGFFTRLFIYLSAVLFSLWFAARDPDAPLEWTPSLVSLALFSSTFLLVQASQTVIDYPFRLSWSEGNRFYDYSVLFGRRLYNFPADQPFNAFIDIGRQSLWGLPFLFGDISIQVMRCWSQFLFTVPYILLGWAFIRRRETGTGVFFLFGLWSMLFLSQGPIYTPLIFAAILVALTRRSPIWLAAIVIATASYYTRLARFTWLFAPAMWAVLIAFLQTYNPPITTRQRWIRSLVLGVSGILGGYLLPELVNWINPAANASFTVEQLNLSAVGNIIERQPLLWNRLLPNETYSLGIVPGLLLATSPLWVVLITALARKIWKLDTWQTLYLSAMSLAFLAVGLVISVKIGGGSNLHNLDMLLVGMVFTAGIMLESGGKRWLMDSSTFPRLEQFMLIMLLLYPVSIEMFKVTPRILPEDKIIQQALLNTQELVDEYKTEGEVLFLDQRQLLTFGYVEDVPLVTDYEKKLLMEMAMQNQEGYFDGFYRDLAAHRFSLIVSEPLFTSFQEEEYNFGNENNAWVRWVSIPLLCYYEPVSTYSEVGLQFLVPKTKSPPDDGLICPEY